MLDIYKERFANNINIFFLLILTSIPSMLIELKYGFDIFYNERIRAKWDYASAGNSYACMGIG